MPKRTANNGSFKPGNKGRPPGVQNKITTAAKEAFAQSFEDMGGVAGLVAWGRKNPTEFYRLYSKLIPVDVTSGEQGLIINVVKRTDAGSRD